MQFVFLQVSSIESVNWVHSAEKLHLQQALVEILRAGKRGVARLKIRSSLFP